MEGVSDETILTALENAGYETKEDSLKKITKTDFYTDGLCGLDNSTEKRESLKRKLKLPKHLSANMLLDVLNRLYTYDEYKKFIDELDEE